MLRTALLVTASLISVGGIVPSAYAADTGTSISGFVFEDADRDGVHTAGEAIWSGSGVDLYDGGGLQVGTTSTDTAGHYSFTGLAAGTYTVAYSSRGWQDLRSTWVPTTSGGLQPRLTMSASGSVSADLGMRRIVRSTTVGSPLSRVVGADGLVVESYNDAVTAGQVQTAIAASAVRGAEAGSTIVRFDVGSTNVTTFSYAGQRGSYAGFSAQVQSSWLSWLDQADASLLHEYGHAWSLYHAYIVQQDESLAAYLQARGVAGDPRLGSSTPWTPEEMIAEDFRQLFGSPTARLRPQSNTDLPSAKDVPDLATFLSTTFMTAPTTGATTPTQTTAPAPAPALGISSVAMNPAPVTKSGSASFQLSSSAAVTVQITTLSGKLIRTLMAARPTSAGTTTLLWDRRSDNGARASAGDYILEIAATSGSATATGSAVFKVR